MPLFCQIRKEEVAEQPEEIVRQRVIRHMIAECKFPPSLISVEKSLNQLPHLALANPSEIPKRRADVIVFAKNIHAEFSLYPLLLVECKAVKLTDRTILQAAGYNQSVGAPFLMLVNQFEMRTGWKDHASNQYTFVNYLPKYNDLIKAIQASAKKG